MKGANGKDIETYSKAHFSLYAETMEAGALQRIQKLLDRGDIDGVREFITARLAELRPAMMAHFAAVNFELQIAPRLDDARQH